MTEMREMISSLMLQNLLKTIKTDPLKITIIKISLFKIIKMVRIRPMTTIKALTLQDQSLTSMHRVISIRKTRKIRRTG